MLEILFFLETSICLNHLHRFHKMYKGAKQINVLNLKEAKEVLRIEISKAIYHFMVCLILWFTFRIK